ncbi:MAG: HD-like signal output (HDOD) protein [Planctomycetota bacterium]|jgi:HD-like signal output (HDOD) protein
MTAPTASERKPFTTLRPEELRQRVHRLKNLPTLPLLQQRIVSALEDPEIDFENVAQLIEIDQSLTAQILRMANSAFFDVQGSISSVTQALVMLGETVSRSLVLSSTVFDLSRVPLRGFWEHSLGCAVAAGAISKVTGRGAPEEVTAAGLMHDLGVVVLCSELPDAFEHIVERARTENRPIGEIELEVLGLEHGELGCLAEKWHFPPCLAEPIMFHNTPEKATVAVDEVAVVHVANSLVRGLGYGAGFDSRVPAINDDAWQRLGLTPEALDQVLETFAADLDHALNYAIFA